MVLSVLPEEAGVEAVGLGELLLGDDLVDAAIEVLAARRIRDGAVETKFHGSPLGALPAIRSIRAHSASVTTSTSTYFSVGSSGSGEASVTAVTMPTTALSFPEW